MPFQVDTLLDLTEHHTPSKYIISSKHRKTGNPNKSVWTIKNDEEVECFIYSITKNWRQENEAWGIRIHNNTLQVVGKNDINDDLKLAKFVDGNRIDVWHGYPADYVRKQQDRPTTEILKTWVINGYITKSKMLKIRKCQPCNL